MSLARFALVGLFVAGVAAAAAAQSPPTQLRGTVTAVAGNEITIAAREGGTAKVRLADNWSVLELSKLDPAKIPSGAYVGAGAARLPDGGLRAVRIVVFPEAMRGTGEGHRAWDVVPDGTMTNAPVVATVTGSAGPVLTLSTGGQTYTITVPPDTNVILMEPGDRATIKAGTPVAVTAARTADGTLTSARVQTGKGGTELPN